MCGHSFCVITIIPCPIFERRCNYLMLSRTPCGFRRSSYPRHRDWMLICPSGLAYTQSGSILNRWRTHGIGSLFDQFSKCMAFPLWIAGLLGLGHKKKMVSVHERTAKCSKHTHVKIYIEERNTGIHIVIATDENLHDTFILPTQLHYGRCIVAKYFAIKKLMTMNRIQMIESMTDTYAKV